MAPNYTTAEKQGLLAQAEVLLAPYAVGFVKLERLSDREELHLGGSGTFVKAGTRYAILTADHVVQNLPAKGAVGLILCLRREGHTHRFTVEAELVERVTLGSASHSATGPDLALLVLPPPIVHDLKAYVSFCDLAHHQTRMIPSPPLINEGGWILWGIVEEWVTERPGEYGFRRIKEFRSLCGGSGILGEDACAGFDYLHFRVKCGGAFADPTSYAGMSGGGLWQVFARPLDGTFQLFDPLFSGVAFYQTDIENDHRTIVCHGRKSVYEHALSALAQQPHPGALDCARP